MDQLVGSKRVVAGANAFATCRTCGQTLSQTHDRLVTRLVYAFMMVVILLAFFLLYSLRGLIWPPWQLSYPITVGGAIGGSLPTQSALGGRGQNNAHNLTWEHFARLKSGMTYQQVKRILKYDGDVGGVSSITGLNPKIPAKMIHWQNPNGSNIGVLFRGNRLIFKTQFRLAKPTQTRKPKLRASTIRAQQS